MEAQKQSIKSTQKSDVIVFFLAIMIVCTLVGKGIVSLCDTEYRSLLHATK
jgi:hypothetical protein